MIITVDRYHDISCGHRVAGHESKCAFLHGHNYRITFTCEAQELDSVGRVIDFSVIKAKLCMWLEENWDHKFLAWEHDDVMRVVDQALYKNRNASGTLTGESERVIQSVVWVPFNPTAENIGQHLLAVVGPTVLEGTGVTLVRVRVEETRKCSATVERDATFRQIKIMDTRD